MPTVAFRAIRSRRKFVKAPQVQKQMGAVLTGPVEKHFVGEFEDVVSDWSGKPRFRALSTFSMDFIKTDIKPFGPNKQKWIWVSRGTKGPYNIPSAGPSFLAFTLGYSARTKPRGQAHVGSGTASGPTVMGIMQVTHPGIEAREFEEVIREENKAWYSRTMENAWRRIIRSL